MKLKLTIALLIFTLLVPTLALAETVSNSDFVIQSSKDTYFCENIINSEGCLVKTDITIIKTTPGNKLVTLDFDSNREISFRDHADKRLGFSIALEKSKGKNIQSLSTYLIESNVPVQLEVNFFASESGKFNYSIHYDSTSLVLDPFFNVTHNVTSPSLHLIEGANNTILDSEYSSTVDITSGLSDGSDATTFQTNTLQNASAIYRFEEGSGTVAIDSSGNGNNGTITQANYINSFANPGTGNFALDFDGVNDKIEIVDNGQFQFGNSINDEPFTMMIWANISDITTFRIAYKYVTGKEFIWGFTGADDLLMWIEDDSTSGVLRADSAATQTSIQNTWKHLAVTYNANASDEGIQHYVDGVAIAMTFLGTGSYVAMEDTGEDVQIAFGGGSNFGEGALDELNVFKRVLNESEILDIFNNGLPITSSAIKATFNVTLNPPNQYWLRTRKTSTGVDDISVYLYQDNNTINQSTLDTHTITTGWDVVPLSNSIIDGANATFRFFTFASSEISEVQLIEGINDSGAPSIINCQVNNTALNCNDAIRFSCNVTDDNFIDIVNFGFDDNENNFIEADKIIDTDIFFIDKTYGFTTSNNDTFNFTNATATDAVQNINITNLSIQFSYSCLIDSLPPTVTLNSPSNDLTTNITNQIFQCSATDETELQNITLYHNVSGTFEQNETGMLSGLSGTSFFNISIPANNTIIWNCEASDTSDNLAFAGSNFTLTVVETLPTLINPIGIILLNPDNNSINRNGTQIFTYSVNTTANTSVFINDILNQSFTDVIGTKSFAITFTTNQTINWRINASNSGAASGSETRILILNLTDLPQAPDTGEVPFTQCAETLEQVLLIWLIVFLALVFMIIGWWQKLGFVGFFGALLFMVTSWYLAPCFNLFSLILAFMSFIFIIYFTFIVPIGFKNEPFKQQR